MPVIQADVFGSPNIGAYCFCNENVVIVPPGLTSRKMKQFSEALGVPVCESTIGTSTLVGALVAGNSNGILVPHTVRDYEVERVRKFTRAEIVECNWTAFGNVLLTNDLGAVVHPDAPGELVRKANEVLSINPVNAKIGTLPYVGALGFATNIGAILSPNVLKEEREVIEGALHVGAEVSTTNGGVPFVRSGIIANSKGAVLGPLTRGVELMQISRALQF